MGSLVAQLGIADRELVAFVGAGGKSTLTLGLGRSLAESGRRVVVTTTTKMGVSQVPDWAVTCHTAGHVHDALGAGRAAFLVGSIEGEKVIGVAPDLVDAIYVSSGATVVAEADGARRRPFKAPGPREPVIPHRATLVVVVVGFDAIGGRVADVCHRPERVSALTGRSLDDLVRPEDVATVAAHPEGGRKHVPAGARLVVALTKTTSNHAARVARIRELVAPIELVEIADVRDR